MPFEITPEDPTGAPAEPENTTAFAITPETATGTPAEPENTTAFAVDAAAGITRPATPPSFLQWLQDGIELGAADVLVINIRYPLVATRGVGEQENVITIKRADPLISIDDMQIPVPLPLVGELIEPDSLYYTSILYPLFNQDDMSVSTAPDRGTNLTIDTDDMTMPVPLVLNATLSPTISFLTYDPRAYPDTMQMPTPEPQSGTLIVVISYLTYDPSAYPDMLQMPTPEPQSSTLIVVISYLTYDNSLLYPDTMQIPVPTPLSGTLT